MVYVSFSCFRPDGTAALMATSVEHPKVPITRKYVRATLNTGGWFLEPMDDTNKTRITYIGFADLGGSLPKWIVNKVAQDIPMTPSLMNKFMRSGKIDVAKSANMPIESRPAKNQTSSGQPKKRSTPRRRNKDGPLLVGAGSEGKRDVEPA